MGNLHEPFKAKLITAIFFTERDSLAKAKDALEKKFGPIDYEGREYDFSLFTHYYTEEMGTPLIKKILSFEELIRCGDLADIKTFTNDLEDSFAHNSKRSVNIDAGYLTDANLVLATTKNYSHRICLSKYIFAELALLYKRGQYNPLPWTYYDFKSKLVLEDLREIRSIYLKQKGPH